MTVQSPPSISSERATLIQAAFWLEWITVVWMIIEGAAAVAAAIFSGSISLLAFGLDSLIELISAGVLIWRLSVELRGGQLFSESAERFASRVGGGLLFALAIYVVASAAWSLWTSHGQDFSTVGLAVTVAAIPIMYVLSKRKLKVAEALGSRAMRADAVESVTCGYLAATVIVGLLVQLVGGFWWVDAVTSLGIVWFLIKESREAWGCEGCGDSCH